MMVTHDWCPMFYALSFNWLTETKTESPRIKYKIAITPVLLICSIIAHVIPLYVGSSDLYKAITAIVGLWRDIFYVSDFYCINLVTILSKW